MNAEIVVEAPQLRRRCTELALEPADEVRTVRKSAFIGDLRDRSVRVHDHPVRGTQPHVAPVLTGWYSQVSAEQTSQFPLRRSYPPRDLGDGGCVVMVLTHQANR